MINCDRLSQMINYTQDIPPEIPMLIMSVQYKYDNGINRDRECNKDRFEG